MDNNDNTPVTILEHESANVIVTKLSSEKNKIVVQKLVPDFYVRFDQIETHYPLELIKQIFEAKGPAWLCDEIIRDESPDYTGAALKWQLLSYIDEDEFKNAKILDFGCGSGASTVCMSRMFPDAQFVGIELEDELLSIAKSRAAFYELGNVEFYLSPNAEKIPENFRDFDYIIMAGVFEHLLPSERTNLLPQLWNALKPGGTLFLNETPCRFFPIETHTTGGLPLINLFPKSLAFPYAKIFSKRNLSTDSWETMLRKGIRGGSHSEILNILQGSPYQPILMQPLRLGVNNRIDLWYLSSDKSRFKIAKRLIRFLMGILRKLTGIELVPYLELAIHKNSRSED